MAIDVNQNVFWFEVTIHDIEVVNVLQAFKQLRKIEFSLVLCEFLDFPEMKEHFSTGTNVHDEKELSFALE